MPRRGATPLYGALERALEGATVLTAGPAGVGLVLVTMAQLAHGLVAAEMHATAPGDCLIEQAPPFAELHEQL